MEPARGEPLTELVAVMRRLRSECAWKREQTHRSLARHLLEELHETLEAIEVGDPDHLREELGDLLLQVYFHAAIAEESGAFTIDDVAQGLIAKLVRRNPHVFGSDDGPAGDGPADAAAVNDLWEAAKAREKQRSDLTEGLPPALPALLYADKVLDRLARRDGAAAAASGAQPTLLLVPSPFLPASVWSPVAWWLLGRGHDVEVVEIRGAREPGDVLAAVRAAAGDRAVVLVPHSNAGLYAPRLTELVDVRGVVYVDAALPGAGSETALAPGPLVDGLAPRVGADGLLPPWTAWWAEGEVADLFPDADTRATVELAAPRLPIGYLRARLPVPSGWARRPAAYLAFGETYAAERDQAAAAGWPVTVLPGGHLHALVDPAAVGGTVEQLVARLLDPVPAASLGDRLLRVVAEARAQGADPEQALREACRRLLTASARVPGA